jgi:type IV pilus assembly protein PilA
MKKWLQKRLKNEKGLTLVELLAVIVILGIIAAIAVPSIGNIVDNSRIKAVKADAQNALAAANMYFTENDDKAQVTIPELIAADFLQDEGALENKAESVIKKGEAGKGGNTITVNGGKGKSLVKITNATSKQITDSKNSSTVPVTSGD